MPMSVGSSLLLRECVHILDTIYSRPDIDQYITVLYDLEARLFNCFYKDLDSFQQDLLQIPQLSKCNLNVTSSRKSKVPEEYCTTPIYESIQLREESFLYIVNILLHKHLHFSLLESIHNEVQSTPLHRLYVAGGKEDLLDTKYNINSILCVFFDTDIQLKQDPEYCHISTTVAIVHPVGDFHPSQHLELEGWIKVKMIDSTKIETVISTELVSTLFNGESEIVRKMTITPSIDLDTARENEVKRNFISIIMATRVNNFKNIYDGNTIKQQHTLHGTDLPCLLADLVPRSRLVAENEKPSVVNHWKKLQEFCHEMQADIVLQKKYDHIISQRVGAGGYFKRVYFANQEVVQMFQRSTASQRVVEIACLLKLRDQFHIGRIKEIIHDNDGIEVVGLTMVKYDMTLRDYLRAHTHHRLTHYQRMDIILQMIRSIRDIHQQGIAHRDLSTVNFMVNMCHNSHCKLSDGSSKIDLYLIDFGKAVFFHPQDAKDWWVDDNESTDYQDEVKPTSKEELVLWCKNLPWVMAKPDHGYRFYRSIQTLPRSQKDHGLLPYLIDPAAEDVYSLGTLVWSLLSGMEPWPGIFDTDLKKLRETVSSDYFINALLDREVRGDMTKTFLKMFLRASPEHRQSADAILVWIGQPHVMTALLDEWGSQYISGGRSLSRRRSDSISRTSTSSNSHKSSPIPEQYPILKRKATIIEAVNERQVTNPKRHKSKITLNSSTRGYSSNRINDSQINDTTLTVIHPANKTSNSLRHIGRPKKKKHPGVGRPKGSFKHTLKKKPEKEPIKPKRGTSRMNTIAEPIVLINKSTSSE